MEGTERRIAEHPLSGAGSVLLDEAVGAIRSWFNPDAKPLTVGPFAPDNLARAILEQSATALRWRPGLLDLSAAIVDKGPGAFSVRFRQEFKGLPVDVSEVVVNLTFDARLHSLYNQYHYDIPQALDPTQVKVSALQARALASRLARPYRRREIGAPKLIVYRHQHIGHGPPRPSRRRTERTRFLRAVQAVLAQAKRRGHAAVPGSHYLAWDITVAAIRPRHRWRLLVDAVTGALLEARDLLVYAQPQGMVFDPNPIVTSGDMGLSSKTKTADLNAERIMVDLERLDSPDVQGNLYLRGAWAHIVDPEKPHVSEPKSATGQFIFSSKSQKFLDVMVYYHIDRFQQYVREKLSVPYANAFSIPVDPQGQDGADNSTATGSEISFGSGGIPDSADAMVIVHEYGHALQDWAKSNSSLGNQLYGVSEGFADFLAAVYFDDRHVNSATRGRMFSWDANPTDGFWEGRTYAKPAPANTQEWEAGGNYDRGELWSSAMFELYRKLGGDSVTPAARNAAQDLSIRLHLLANGQVPSQHATIPQMAQEIQLADLHLAGWRYPNGLHQKIIRDTFTRRKVVGYAPLLVDVYVDDGRGGGYGAANGNDDNFQNTLWQDNFTSTKDIWIRRAPYAGGAVPKPADHESPLKNQPANVHVQVKNRGVAGSGPVTVRLFRAAAGGPRLWSSGWTEIPPPPAQPPDVPAAGAVTAGPFAWTPAAAGKISLLAIVECATDRAVTQDLGADPGVPFGDLVPFDNNIAMRDIQVDP